MNLPCREHQVYLPLERTTMSSIGGHRLFRSSLFRRLLRRWTKQGIEVLLNGCPIEAGVLPQPLGDHHRVDASGPPPIDFVAVPVNGPMVGAAERNGEFVADPAPHGSRLRKPQMVSIRRLPSA